MTVLRYLKGQVLEPGWNSNVQDMFTREKIPVLQINLAKNKRGQ